MVLTSVAPAPSFTDRFRSAWRGEESLAWVFWSYYVLVGIGLGFIDLALRFILSAMSGSDLGEFGASPLGAGLGVLSDFVKLGYLGVAFVLFVRCISNVHWRGWQYIAMCFLLAISHALVERARDIGAVVLGV